MYQRRVTSRPRSVEATIFSIEELPPPKTRFMGASPYSLGRAKPWPVGCLLAALLAAREAFAIEMGALLQRVINVVGNGDVLAEELFAHALVQAGTLVCKGGSGEIVKKKTDEIEHGGRFEDYGVTAGGKFAGIDGEMRLFAGARRKFLWVVSADIGGVGFGPACGRAFLNGDGKFGVRFAIGGEETARIRQRGLALAIRIDSSGDLAFLDCQVTGTPDRAGAVFAGESSGRLD